jgi:DNA-binding IclR family transcriptional regulator
VYSLLKRRRLSSSEIVKATGFGKTKAVSILNNLVAGGYIETTGQGRGLKYFAL